MIELTMQISRLIISSLLYTHIFAFNGGPISDKVIQKAERKYGGEVLSRYVSYNEMLEKTSYAALKNKLQSVNDFFNAIPFQEDITNWKEEDYWATPLEFLARNKGDSEDYAIAKYFALKTLGVDTKKLYFTYVNSKKFSGPHIVLSYFETPQSEPFILDNSNPDILPASQRPDLTPVYNFNPGTTKEEKQNTHKKWEILNNRVKRNKQ